MKDKSILLNEMIPKILATLEEYGYEKHTLWGNIYGVFSSLKAFYAEQGITTYDPETTKAFVERARARYELGAIRLLPGLEEYTKWTEEDLLAHVEE